MSWTCLDKYNIRVKDILLLHHHVTARAPSSEASGRPETSRGAHCSRKMHTAEPYILSKGPSSERNATDWSVKDSHILIGRGLGLDSKNTRLFI